ncbi:hypothetical protein BJV82DRAFT_713642 [Fennellomyces sp. T-0311]|nr:hypothetical protein BJV82DRAFT_713642 [Fennellomyces sp. T-0311]
MEWVTLRFSSTELTEPAHLPTQNMMKSSTARTHRHSTKNSLDRRLYACVYAGSTSTTLPYCITGISSGHNVSDMSLRPIKDVEQEELEQPVRNARVLLPDCRNGSTALEAGTRPMSGSPCTSSFRGARWATTSASPKTTSMMTRTGGTGLQAHIYDRALTRHAASRDVVCTVHDYSPGRIFVVEAEPLVEQTDMVERLKQPRQTLKKLTGPGCLRSQRYSKS